MKISTKLYSGRRSLHLRTGDQVLALFADESLNFNANA